MSRSLANFFQVAVLLLLLLTAALVAAIMTMHMSIHGAEVQVPVFKGMTVADAHSMAAGLGLNLDVDNRYYSADVAAGHILTQSPAPGTVVRREWKVLVSESLGPQQVDVPDTVGSEERMAELNLRRASLDVGQVVRMPMPGVAEGTVIAQDPPAHAHGIAQPKVDLLVAAAPAAEDAPDGWVMPDLTGELLVAAQGPLQRAGIHVTVKMVAVPVAPIGKVGAEPRQPIKPGSVISQIPAAGNRVEQSTVVQLTVAR